MKPPDPVSPSLTRRSFLGAAGAAAAATLLEAGPRRHAGLDPLERRRAPMRVALVGTGSRGSTMWGRSMVEAYGGREVELVALCDLNPGRLAYVKRFIGIDCPTYLHSEFDQMIRETAPDRLIVTTVDATHEEYIRRGMELGCDIIAEKPITTDEHRAQRLIDTQARTGRDIIATFNVRYMPIMVRIKELLAAARVGAIRSVDFNWYLDVHHGASYFRRWHGKRRYSGTLLVHKASHHFDVLNWWLDSDPEEVFAYGDLVAYGRNGPYRHARCMGCPFAERCLHFWDIRSDDDSMRLYVDHEEHDGYIRDGCVFSEEIDIFDRMAVQMRYANGVTVSYSLNAFLPYEGLRIAFNGALGRLEAWIQYNQPWEIPAYDEIRVTDSFGETELIRVSRETGAHGGADDLLKDRIFRTPDAPDPLGQAAGLRDGIMGILIGVAARNSIASGAPVRIADLTSIRPQPVRPRLG